MLDVQKLKNMLFDYYGGEYEICNIEYLNDEVIDYIIIRHNKCNNLFKLVSGFDINHNNFICPYCKLTKLINDEAPITNNDIRQEKNIIKDI